MSYPKKRRSRQSPEFGCAPKRQRTGADEYTPEDVDQMPLTAPCQFCHSSEQNEADLGPMHYNNGVTVHYFCMLLSSGLVQNSRPSDKNSILGFTIPDIRAELRRSSKLRCSVCHKKGASIGCCVNSCKSGFHLTCGREHGTMHEFFGSYRSYCAKHWQGPGTTLKSCKDIHKETCSICLTAIGKINSSLMVIPPCCRIAVFHHSCMQKFALSSGLHYFRCPLCNATKKFKKGMLQAGIFIPDRDASWERDSNAYQEHLERPDSCEISPCMCPQGAKHNAKFGRFTQLICELCGSYSAHRACAGLHTKATRLLCPACAGT